jgi:AraC-like DNA-binding protein
MYDHKEIICEKRGWTEQLRVHAHPFGHLLFPLKGQLVIETKTQFEAISDERVLYLPAECEHAFGARKDWTECLVIDIPSGLPASRLAAPESAYGLILDINQDWRALRSLMLSEQERDHPALSNLLQYSLHLLTRKQEPVSIQYLHAHYMEPITIEDLAKMEHFNASYYSQWFKSRMNMTPMQYVRQLRVQEAKRLLLETDYTIADITQAVGYSCQSHLTKVFEQLEQISPFAFRIQNRHKKN